MAACGQLECLKEWLDKISKEGPKFGYFPEPDKSYVIVKKEFHDKARDLLGAYGVKIVTGSGYLGGNDDEKSKFIQTKVEGWCHKIQKLTEISENYPHETFYYLTKSVQAEWNFVSRVVPQAGDMLIDVEEQLRDKYLCAVFARPLQDHERDLVSLPARKGGLGIENPNQNGCIAI